ncbi:hypothetical protein SHKM778_48250 [Streptomyces sp. KM77-8]|uniref:Uncharacterized protein n=1 Tax=Streptomyces haneummycinicus TaxID=3074435 RepID=A0AAT9HLX3_9ACTN
MDRGPAVCEHGPRADRLCRRTATRPFAPGDGPAVRVCLLTYADRVQDLVVGARPEALDEGGLAGLACLLVEEPSESGPLSLPEPVEDGGGERLALEWASGASAGPGTRENLTVTLGSDAGEAAVLASLTTALARRTGGAVPALVLRRPGPADPGLARTDTATAVRPPAPGKRVRPGRPCPV